MNEIVTTWWIGLMMASAVILFAIVGVHKLHEWGVYPLREMTRFVRRPWFERLLLMFFICGMIHYGATKGTNGMDNAAPPSPGLMMAAAPVVSPVAVDSIGFSLPTNFPPVTNLCFWGIERDTSSVSLGIAWPGAIHPANNCIDLFGNWRLATNGWSHVAQVDICGAQSNAIVQVDFADLPTNAMESTAFYLLANQTDTDGDGLSDAFERMVSGTSPSNIDSDEDGIGDGDEIVMGTNPLSDDTDGDGISDAVEAGTVEVLPRSEVLWLPLSSRSSLWSSRYERDSNYTHVNLPRSYTINGVTYSQIKLCVDGMLYLLDPGNSGAGFTYMVTSPPVLGSDQLSVRHVAIAGFCDDLYVSANRWGSCAYCGYANEYRIGGAASVIELNNIGFRVEAYGSSPHLFDCQVILPNAVPNVFYLTYSTWDDGTFMAARNPTIGVQCPALASWRTGEMYYNLTWKPLADSFSANRTVKFTIGLGTNPKSADTDGDGIDDGDELAMGTNPLVWDDTVTDLEQELPDGANTNAYYWVDVASAKYTHVTFSGDGESDLTDPDFMLAAGDTCRVKLLIGKTYSVSSRHPIFIAGRSSDEIEIEGNGTTSLTIRWPVEIYAIEGNGAGFMMDIIPNNLNGVFDWVNTCCPVTGYDDHFWFACGRNCTCGGCGAEGYYCYEGYEKACDGGWCDCTEEPAEDPYAPEVDDGPYAAGVSVSFSKSAVIFEDAYTNMPGEVVSRRSTQTTLTCIAHGGERGGTAEFTLTGENKLLSVSGGTLPVARFVPPGQKLEFEIVYEGVKPSDNEEDIVASAEFIERETGNVITTEEGFLTSVRSEIRPNDLRQGCEYRHVMGIREKFYVTCYPEIEGMNIHIHSGWIGVDDVEGDDVIAFRCPITSDDDGLEIRVADALYVPRLIVIEPSGLVCNQGVVIDLHYGVNRAGGIGMSLIVGVQPDCVSFGGIKMMERPVLVNPTSPQGYFANEDYSGAWTHNTTMGAGVWYSVLSANNIMFEDEAKFGEECPSPWFFGQINWTVPICWGDSNATTDLDIVEELGTVYHQVFTIDAEGGVKVDKFGQWVRRTPSGTITHSPDIENPAGEDP